MAMPEAKIAIEPAASHATTAGSSVMRDYYELTKPGISQMVAMTTLAGYYLAIPTDLLGYITTGTAWLHFVVTMVGTLAVSSGSCVVNHILERERDQQMKRTAQRPIPAGRITLSSAWVFGALLTVLGIGMLAMTNALTVALAIITWLSYVAVYTPMKRRSRLALYVGGVPGALPFAGGWTAVRGSMDMEAWALFAILFFWQLPHFFALSWMYRQDYAQGGFAMHAVEDTEGKALGNQMITTSALTALAALVPTLMGITGWLYGTVALGAGLWLVAESVRFRRDRQTGTARRVLLTSYAVLMGIIFLMFLDKH